MPESRRLKSVQAPIIPVIADLIRAHPGTISLGQGVVSYGPPSAAVTEITRFLAEPPNHNYQGVSGILTLREGITQKLAAENCVDVGEAHGNRLMVTAGGNQAFLNVVLGILDPGDEVILPVPVYFNHEMAIAMANARPVLAPTDSDYQLDLGALRSATRRAPALS